MLGQIGQGLKEYNQAKSEHKETSERCSAI